MVKTLKETIKEIEEKRTPKTKILFDETSIYILAAGFILTLIIYSSTIFNELLELIVENLRITLFLGLGAVGCVLAIKHAFKKGIKTDGDAAFLFYFIFLFNGLFGLHTAIKVLVESKGILIVFPIINLVYAFYFLFSVRMGKVGAKNISQRDATKKEIIISTILVIATILISKYALKNPWYLTTSMIAALSAFVFNIMNWNKK